MQPNFLLRLTILLCALSALRATVGCAQTQPALKTFGTLLSFDFEAKSWPQLTTEAVGTIDVAGSTQPSQGLRAMKTLSSGPLTIANRETNLGKLTLAFSLSSSAARPVKVLVESFDAAQQRSGGLETTITPAAPDFYQRYALDLSNFKPSGAGTFQADAPFVGFSFETDNGEIRLDNVQYAVPTFYVSSNGNDQNDGRSENSALATPQKAVSMAGPGDIIVVMNGTYQPVDVQGGIAAFRRGGTPAAWISLKNYPGQTPLFFLTNAWAAVRIGRSKAEKPADGGILPTLCYIEVRGLHIRGEGDVAQEKYAEFLDKADPHTNGNGIMVDGGNESNTPHHLRFADNLVEFCPGGGIGDGDADWVTTENNVVRNNCWWMIYAGSGISYLSTANFDGADNVYKDLIRNNIVSGNRCFLKWRQIGKFSDGNGIIVDSNHVPAQNKSHNGRTLIQNNLSFNNGGSGIHSFKSHRVDIINNTAYFNGATPELRWGQIFLQRTDDARVMNNILVSRDDQPINTVSANSNDKENTNVVRSHNLYFGGNSAPIMGEHDSIADPQFVNPSVDATVADFHLKAGSPALGAGVTKPFGPLLDLDGQPRGATPTMGVYEK